MRAYNLLRSRNGIAIALLTSVSAFVACSKLAPGSEGSSCPNDRNCLPGLRCIQGACTPAPDMDAGVMMMMDMGQPPPPPPPPMDAGQEPDMGMIVKETDDEFNSGPFSLTPIGGMRVPDLSGTAGMMRIAAGETSVLVQVLGLAADTEYPAHVHALPCAMEGGGPHYKIDDMIMDVVEENEIWPSITTGPEGSGRGTALVAHLARPEAQSVVIHDPDDGERLACADLNPAADLLSRGNFEELPAGMGKNISGTVTMRRWSRGGTEVNVLITGDLEMAIHPAHVHNQPCAVEMGGAHYKIDETIMDVVEENEIWPSAMVDMDGRGQGNAYVPHVARHNAYSVVVHDPENGDRLACADLYW